MGHKQKFRSHIHTSPPKIRHRKLQPRPGDIFRIFIVHKRTKHLLPFVEQILQTEDQSLATESAKLFTDALNKEIVLTVDRNGRHYILSTFLPNGQYKVTAKTKEKLTRPVPMHRRSENPKEYVWSDFR